MTMILSKKQMTKEGIKLHFIMPALNADGWRPCKGQLDYYGNEIEDHICNNRDFDYNVILADMVREVFLRVNE